MRSPPESCHAPSHFPARCSATRSGPSRPDRSIGSFPPVDRPAALMGFDGALRRFAPATGGISSLNGRARMPFASVSPTRSVFVGLIPPHGNKETIRAEIAAAIRETWTLASGLHSRLRSAWLASFFSPSRAFLPWALPLAGFRARRSRIRAGSTLPRSPRPGGLHPPYPLMGLGGPCGSAPPSLQRIQSPDASPTRAIFEHCPGKLPV